MLLPLKAAAWLSPPLLPFRCSSLQGRILTEDPSLLCTGEPHTGELHTLLQRQYQMLISFQWDLTLSFCADAKSHRFASPAAHRLDSGIKQEALKVCDLASQLCPYFGLLRLQMPSCSRRSIPLSDRLLVKLSFPLSATVFPLYL